MKYFLGIFQEKFHPDNLTYRNLAMTKTPEATCLCNDALYFIMFQQQRVILHSVQRRNPISGSDSGSKVSCS